MRKTLYQRTVRKKLHSDLCSKINRGEHLNRQVIGLWLPEADRIKTEASAYL